MPSPTPKTNAKVGEGDARKIMKLKEYISNIMKIDAKKIMEQVRENHRLLGGCTKHEFTPVDDSRNRFTTKYVCSNCKGTVDNQAYRWYLKGLEHGQG